MKSLNKLRFLRLLLVHIKRVYYTRFWKMDLHPTCTFSMRADFDKTYPRGVHVGPESYIAFGATILTHDMVRGLYLHTRVGARCFVGARSIILPGVQIGDGSIIGSGSVVTKDVPPKSIVAGNPAQIVRGGIEVGRYGRLPSADSEEKLRLKEAAFS